MAATKLTLRLDEEIIARGKVFAREQGTSLSRLFEQFLREQTKDSTAYIPVEVIEPDPELGRLFPPRPQFSHSNTSLDEMRDDYYSSILNREKVEEE
jgi:hypothetical protein